MGNVAFSCERSGLAGALLGGYDGAGSWRVFVDEIDGEDEHLLVQVHEAMHHELQTSTSWGSVVAMAGTLAKRGIRRHALLEVFDRGVELSTNVHEVYATALSDSIGRQRWEQDPLEDNLRYRAYRERALRLVPSGPGIDEQIRMAAIAAVLRCCMQPASMLTLAAQLDFRALRAVALGAVGPDRRLDLFEAAVVRDDWIPLLSELTESDPGYQQQMLAQRRPSIGDDLTRLAEQWEFETVEVQRRCYEFTARILESQGSPSIPWSDLGAVAERIVAAVGEADEDLGRVVQLAANRPPDSGTDVLEFSRQAIALRPPLPIEVASIDTASTLQVIDGLVVQEGTDEEHVCAVWCPPKVLRKQFQCPPLPASSCALLTRAKDENGNSVARVGFMDAGTTPQVAQLLVSPRPLLVLTTHYSLTDDSILECLRAADPIYVLMDLPIGWHIDDWVRQGAVVRYAVVTVNPAKELGAIVVSVDRAPNLHFFHVGGLVALGSLFERLRQRHDNDSVVYDEHLLHDKLAGLSLAVSHVVHTFHVLDQDGVE